MVCLPFAHGANDGGKVPLAGIPALGDFGLMGYSVFTQQKQRKLLMIRILVTAVAFAVVPALGFAMCAGKHQEAQSCVAGMVWDAEKAACVQQASS